MANNRIYLYHPRSNVAVAVVKCLGMEWFTTNEVADRLDRSCDIAYNHEPIPEDTTWEIRYEHHEDPCKALPIEAVLYPAPSKGINDA